MKPTMADGRSTWRQKKTRTFRPKTKLRNWQWCAGGRGKLRHPKQKPSLFRMQITVYDNVVWLVRCVFFFNNFAINLSVLPSKGRDNVKNVFFNFIHIFSSKIPVWRKYFWYDYIKWSTVSFCLFLKMKRTF